MAYSLLKSEALKLYLYNFVPGMPTMEHFQQFYCEYWEGSVLAPPGQQPLSSHCLWGPEFTLSLLLFQIFQGQESDGRWVS